MKKWKIHTHNNNTVEWGDGFWLTPDKIDQPGAT